MPQRAGDSLWLFCLHPGAVMKISLNSLPLSGRIAVTLFLILLWYGYILASLNTRLAVGTTIESIAEHYEDHSLTKGEAQEIEEKGFVEEEVVIEHHEEPLKKGEQSITPQEIVQLGHIHIFGFSLLFISLAAILILSAMGERWKIILLSLLFLFLSLDIGGLFLVRFVSRTFAVIPFISGIGSGAGIATISLIALYDLWLRKG